MECTNCYAILKSGMKFCPKCGTKVEELKQLNEVRPPLRYCEKCGNPLLDDSDFCLKCGAPVRSEDNERSSNDLLDEEAPIIRCGKCGAPVEQGMRFCLSCGNELGEDKEPLEAELQQCSNCSAPLEPGMLFCLSCGAEQKHTEAKWKRIPPPAVKPELREKGPVPQKGSVYNNKRGNGKRIILISLLCIIFISALVVLGVVLFKQFNQKSNREPAQTDIVVEEPEEKAKDNSEEEQVKNEAESTPIDGHGEDEPQQAEPDQPKTESTEDSSASKTQITDDSGAKLGEMPEEPQYPANSPAAEESKEDDQYTFYLYRQGGNGTLSTGSASLDVWDCDPSKYLWPTDSVSITNEDLNHLTMEQIDFVRNEIYARHGYQFVKNMVMKSYFESRTWYRPNPDFSADLFNKIESDNINVIVEYQKAQAQ